MPSGGQHLTSKEIPLRTVLSWTTPCSAAFSATVSMASHNCASSLGSGRDRQHRRLFLTNHMSSKRPTGDPRSALLLDGRKSSAIIVGTGPRYRSWPVLKIELKNLPAITLGHAEQIQVGTWTLAIGNSFGVGQAVTWELLAALGRSHLGINTFENFHPDGTPQSTGKIPVGRSGGRQRAT